MGVQAGALRAAEAALDKKRQALQQAERERDAADAAFRKSLAQREADDVKVFLPCSLSNAALASVASNLGDNPSNGLHPGFHAQLCAEGG
jgi:hypothetical protein